MNGVFKIPQMPSKYKKEEIFSQYVEEDDAYEMVTYIISLFSVATINLNQYCDKSISMGIVWKDFR